MNLPEPHIIRHIASVAELSESWCRQAMVRICHDDVADVVKDEVNKLQRSHETRNRNRPNPDAELFDLRGIQTKTAQQGHHLFATKVVRPLIIESISLRCWKSLVATGRKDGLCGNDFETTSKDYLTWAKRTGRDSSSHGVQNLWIQREIGKLLGVDSSNIGRWEQSKTAPDGNKVLAGIVLVFQRELRGFPYPSRTKILRSMIRRTVSSIRAMHCNTDQSKHASQLIRGDELDAVKAFQKQECERPLFDPENIDEDRANERIVKLGNHLRQIHPKSNIWKPKIMLRTLSDWATPFAMLQVALASGWPDGTESDWNWADIADE